LLGRSKTRVLADFDACGYRFQVLNSAPAAIALATIGVRSGRAVLPCSAP
jgi:hypothetical protein